MASRRNEQRASAREQMRLQQQAAARKKRRTAVVVVVIVALILAMTGIAIGVWQMNQSGKPTNSTTATNPTDSSDPTDTPTDNTTAVSITPPNGTSEMGWIEVRSANTKPDALIVAEHTDYQCPWCALTDSIFGEPLNELVERGDIIMQYHIRTLIGDQLLKNDSSVRAAMASTCADVVGRFPQYHETVFMNQPAEGVGYTDQQLRVDYATQAGITGDDLTRFQTCYDKQQTKEYVLGMEHINVTSTTINGSSAQKEPVTGTPVFFVNGIQMQVGTMLVRIDNVWQASFSNTADGLLAHLKGVADGSITGIAKEE